MSNAVFPGYLPGLTPKVTQAPEFRTLVQEAENGAELRLALRSFPKWTFQLEYEFLRDQAIYPELRTLVGFYLARLGPADSWLFQNPDDYQVTGQVCGVGNGATLDFPLVRAFGPFVEPVFEPDVITAVTVAGVITAFTLQPYGVVRFASPPASGAAVAWSGTFFYRARFSDDHIDPEKFLDKLWKLGKLQFVASLQDKIR